MARGNLALLFGAVVAGAVVIDYGVRNAKGAITSAGSGNDPAGAAPGQTTATTPVQGTPGAVTSTTVPAASWNPQNKPIADWIAPILQWASENGWTGSVTSGYRSYAEQAAINAKGEFSAAAGTSNHEGAVYPLGAVDVTNPQQLLQVLKGYTGPEKLVGGVLGAVDPEHFSATGH